MVASEYDYILIDTVHGELHILDDDDPLYTDFERVIHSDTYLSDLVMLFEHSTEAYIATNAVTVHPQTVANKLFIVADSRDYVVLHNVVAHYGSRRVSVELAMGLGDGGTVDLDGARRRFPEVMAPLLLQLMGLREPDQAIVAGTPLHAPATSAAALWLGYAAALQGLHGQSQPDMFRVPEDTAGRLESDERLSRYSLVPRNGYLFGSTEGGPSTMAQPLSEALHTPGVVATFLFRLVQRADGYYDQRDMLWFANYDPAEIPSAKLLLAAHRMPRISVEAFVQSYVETFPAERAAVVSLVNETFGQGADGALGL